jgi:hypothetical protein
MAILYPGTSPKKTTTSIGGTTYAAPPEGQITQQMVAAQIQASGGAKAPDPITGQTAAPGAPTGSSSGLQSGLQWWEIALVVIAIIVIIVLLVK